MNGLEYALKQVMVENEKLRKERKSREDQESHERKYLATKDLVSVKYNPTYFAQKIRQLLT